MKSTFLLFIVLFSGLATAEELPVVSDPDIAERGWYWLPDEPGWGLNIDIQPVSWNGSGHFVFGTIFTYDENGNPFWYTFQGDYVPNSDVYAWREDRGEMGTFTSPLYQTSGGNAPNQPYQGNGVDTSSLGDITLTWHDPLHATMQIGNTTKEVVYQYYHAGINNPDADFITEGAWYVQGSFGAYGFKGLTKFSPLSLSDTNEWGNDVNFNPDLQWYQSRNNKLITLLSSSFLTDPSDFGSLFYNEVSLILGFDKATNRAFAFLLFDAFGSTGVSVCSTNSAYIASGLLRPAVGANTRLYFSEGELDNCDPSTYTQDEKRQVFVSLTRIPQGGDDLANLPAFQNRNQ